MIDPDLPDYWNEPHHTELHLETGGFGMILHDWMFRAVLAVAVGAVIGGAIAWVRR